MQLQADILGVSVVRPRVSETTSLGAAYAAGMAVGVWKDTDELRSKWQEDRQWDPQSSKDLRDERYRGWKKAIERTLDWV
jgi:glycerol kinase